MINLIKKSLRSLEAAGDTAQQTLKICGSEREMIDFTRAQKWHQNGSKLNPLEDKAVLRFELN